MYSVALGELWLRGAFFAERFCTWRDISNNAEIHNVSRMLCVDPLQTLSITYKIRKSAQVPNFESAKLVADASIDRIISLASLCRRVAMVACIYEHDHEMPVALFLHVW